jgi:CRP-like cAMP-binding protein
MSQEDELILRLLATVKLFSGMSRGELLDLLGIAEKCVFASGEDIFFEGDTGNSMFIIVSGRVEVTRKGGGKSVPLAKLGAGESFGEMALVEHTPRSASVQALESCVTLKIPEERLSQVPEAAARLYRNIARVLSERLKTASDVLLFQAQAGAAIPKMATVGANKRRKRVVGPSV